VSTGQRASERIIEAVTAWPGVAAGPGERGELAFTAGGREIGHLHGDRAAHFAFPKKVWVDLKAKGGSKTTRSSPEGQVSGRTGSGLRATSGT
jgi:hypothetical protein